VELAMKSRIRELLREAVLFILIGVFISGLVMITSAKGVRFSEGFIVGLLLGWMYGGPLGLGTWILYRLFRFAITSCFVRSTSNLPDDQG
jgi:hypothetical protein